MFLILPQDDLNDALAFMTRLKALVDEASELSAKAAKWRDVPLAEAWAEVADYLRNVDHDTLTGSVIHLTEARVKSERIAA